MKKHLFYTLLIAILTLQILHPNVYAAEIPNKSIEIDVDQTNPAAPSVISVAVANDNAEEYQLTLLDHFYTVKEVDAAGAVVFEGQVKRYQVDTVNDEYIEVPENPLTMDLPYFEEARKVQVFYETDKQVLDIDLGLYSIGPTPTPEPRFADCHQCGYCTGRKAPQNLNQCMKCLYPDYVNNPEKTLSVDPTTNRPVKPRTGTFFSQLGCIDVGLAGFRDPAAAGGVLNVILSRFLFPITGWLALISLIYGAYLVMTAQKDPQQLEKGRKWIYGALIGIVFTFCALLLIRIIGGDLLKIPGLDL